MFSAMLEVNPLPDQLDAYLGMAKMLRPELDKIDGFIDNTRYAGLTRDGWLLSLSSWWVQPVVATPFGLMSAQEDR